MKDIKDAILCFKTRKYLKDTTPTERYLESTLDSLKDLTELSLIRCGDGHTFPNSLFVKIINGKWCFCEQTHRNDFWFITINHKWFQNRSIEDLSIIKDLILVKINNYP